jgi:hypothetical protein
VRLSFAIFYLSENLITMVKFLSQKAKPETELILEADPVSSALCTKVPVLTYFSRKVSVVVPGGSVLKARTMAEAVRLLFMLFWVCNIEYPDSIKSFYGVLDKFCRIIYKKRINLGQRARDAACRVMRESI